MDKRLYFLLSTAQQGLRKYVDEQGVERTGLTSAQMGVLFYLEHHDGCLLKELGEGVGVKNAAITGLVARTERTGCIRRRASAEDGRATQVFITAKGHKKLDEIKRLNDELGRRLREGFEEREIAVVLRFLRHVADIAQQAR